MIRKFVYTYWERRKTGPVHNRCWNWSPFTSKHNWIRFSKFWNTFPKVSKLPASIFWCIASLNCSIVRGVFLYTLPFNRPPKRSRQALDRLLLVSNFLTNFWMEHIDGARLSPNSVRNAVWHALNEPVCQYLRTRNLRCSTVHIGNSLGPLARDSLCIISVGDCCLGIRITIEFSTLISSPYHLKISSSLSIMYCSIVSSLGSSTTSAKHFTMRSICPPAMKPPNPSRPYLVKYSLYKYNILATNYNVV